jgi:hypothetical protein
MGDSPSLLEEMQSGTATFEDSLIVSYKTKYMLIVHSHQCVPWYLPKRAKNLCIHKNLQIDIARIWNQTQCSSVGKWINCTSRQWNIFVFEKK